jgi:uncharacterized protein (DUF58 family)
MIAHAPSPAERPAPPLDLPYRIPWRTRDVRAGAHRGTLAGSGGLFRDFVSILDYPDPRRIDLRASVRDPFETIHVRRFEQKSAISIYLLVDVSASMGFGGGNSKIGLAADIAAALATSARRVGDSFGLIGCDSAMRSELTFMATRSHAGERDMVERLRAFKPVRRGALGLAEAASLIAGRRKLVVVISDFLMPDEHITAVFQALSRHDVVPIMITFSSELRRLPRWGLVSLADLETGRRRLVVMRPALREAWQARDEARRAAFRAVANRYGRKPFEIVDRIDWDQLGAHLMGGGG